MKTRHPLPALLVGVLALLGLPAPASAATFCANSAASLQTALNTAAGNGADDEVRIVQGSYVGNFVYASAQANNLSVLGGYTAGCAGRELDPVNTILDGNQTNTVLVLSAPDVAADFLVEGLTLRKGQPASSSGGGLWAKVGTDGTVTVNRNQIKNNTAGDGGGASIFAPTVTLTNNSITGNTASGDLMSGGGGASIYYATTVTLTNNSITGNTASGDGGGGAFIYSAITVTLTNNSITGNTASGYWGGGGGASLSATTVTLTNNNITGNTASGYYGGGGGASLSATTVTLTNNNITGNTANYGSGGAGISASTATLTNNTLVGNTGVDSGGLLLSTGNTETTDSATLYNNLFWDNLAGDADSTADLWINNDGDGDYLPTPVTLLANNFDQSASGFKSDLPITIDPSNLDAEDPLFVDQAAGDLRPAPGSPMIDAGYPDTPNLPATDLDGEPRVLGSAVDIGAYEFDDGSGLPDLVVTSLVLTPTSPFASTTFSVTITVKNQGTRAGTPGTLQLWTDNANEQNCGAIGNQSATWATDLAPGASLTMNMSGLAAGPAGTKTLRAFIDSTCETAESNENNNQLTQAYTVQPPAPDFRITSIVLTPTSPIAYGTFKAVVTVKNFGTVGGKGGYLDVWNNLGRAASCGADGNAWTSVGTLAASASKTFTFTGLRSGATGTKTFRAFVDSYCQTTESRETNNQAVKTYTVVP